MPCLLGGGHVQTRNCAAKGAGPPPNTMPERFAPPSHGDAPNSTRFLEVVQTLHNVAGGPSELSVNHPQLG